MSTFYIVADMSDTPIDEPTDDLIDSTEAAALLGTTVNNLRQMVFKKKLSARGTKNRRLLLSRNEVVALANERVKP